MTIEETGKALSTTPTDVDGLREALSCFYIPKPVVSPLGPVKDEVVPPERRVQLNVA